MGNTVELCAAMSAIDAAAAELYAGLDDAQLSWSPRPGKWSMAENLAHLRATTLVFLPVVDAVIADCIKQNLLRQDPCRMNFFGRLLVWRMDARPILKMQAPQLTQPRLSNPPGHELEQFLLAQRAMRQRIEASDGFDLTALRFPSPLATYLRVNLLEFFSMFNAHSRRHLQQANKVRQALPRPLYSHVSYTR